MPRSTNRTQQTLGAIFIDYEGAHALLRQHHDAPHELIFEVVDSLRREYDISDNVEIVLVRAYADYGMIGPEGMDIQESLDIQGFEPRFVSRARQRNATEVQLCVDAMDLLHQRSDMHTFIFVTGNRLYLPLVSQLRRYGRDVALVTLASAAEDVASGDPGFRSIDMRTLLPRALRVGQTDSGDDNALVRSVQHHPVTDDGARWALRIIEEHFGQYDEVYLTPLLRKLSEVMNDDRFDPKALINTLEEAGAVWLEKRRGSPHDYTVLLVDVTHSDVQEVQAAAAEDQHESYTDEYALADEPYADAAFADESGADESFADEPYAEEPDGTADSDASFFAGDGAQEDPSEALPSDEPSPATDPDVSTDEPRAQ
jgi:hypothetical protein